MQYTGNYNLKKPDGTEVVNIQDLNDNADIIDAQLKSLNENKVSAVAGKQLSTNDYTTTEKTKLAGIAAGANNYVHPTGDGNLHVPATGTTNAGKVLKAGATPGSMSWGDLTATDVGALPAVGTATAALKLATGRTIAFTGDVTGSVVFDGSANVTITTTVADNSHNHTIDNITGLQTALDAKAPIASPAFTGTPTGPTPAAGTNTTQLATTAFVGAAVKPDAWKSLVIGSALSGGLNYRKTPGGQLELDVFLRTSSGSNLNAGTNYVVGTLPTGYLPKYDTRMLLINATTPTADFTTVPFLDISTTGAITIRNQNTTHGPNTLFAGTITLPRED